MPISGVTSPTQSLAPSISQTLQLQMAQRNAEQARENARSLQSEAARAEVAAEQADERAQTLGREAQQAKSVSSQADQSLVSAQTGMRLQAQMGQLAQSVHQATQTLQVPQAPTPVINTMGQTTGQLVNTKA